MRRAPWDEYFILLAKMVALRSGCNSRPAGAVIVKDRRILATGYNGPMPGAWHCTDRGPSYCFRREKGIPDIDKYNYCRATHAEANAVAQAARFGISVEGADLYCTLAPCYVCLKLIASAGIRAVYYEYDYGSRDFERDSFWRAAIEEAGLVAFRQVKVSEEVLAQLEEILVYPTSRRRLAPTEFLEPFASGGTYRVPTGEVLLNRLRYQVERVLRDVRFVIENPGGEGEAGEGPWPGFEEELARTGRFEAEGELSGVAVRVSCGPEGLLARLGEVSRDDLRALLPLLESLACRASLVLAAPVGLELFVERLRLA